MKTAADQTPQEIWQTLVSLAPTIGIAHHVPGRIRLKLSPGAALPKGLALPPGEALRAAFLNIPGVNGLRLNLLARSCTIEYDPQRIAPDAWEDLLGKKPALQNSALFSLLQQAYESAGNA